MKLREQLFIEANNNNEKGKEKKWIVEYGFEEE
jgi:hypothetical protein